MNLVNEKKHLRKRLKAWRKKQSAAAVKQKSNLIVSQLLSWHILNQAKTVFCYVSLADEVDTHFLLKQLIELKKRVAVPKIVGPGKMKPVILRSFSDLTAADYGILTSRSNEFLEDKIDLNLLPAAAVDLAGRRLGMGGGFYDRFIELYQPQLNTALVFAGQVLDFVPADKFDRLMDVIITEEKIYEISHLK